MSTQSSVIRSVDPKGAFSMAKSLTRVALATALVLAMPQSASAISAEVARACNALLAKQFPSRQLGNPAAGSAKGSAKERRDFYTRCVENGGKMDDEATKESEPPKDSGK